MCAQEGSEVHKRGEGEDMTIIVTLKVYVNSHVCLGLLLKYNICGAIEK